MKSVASNSNLRSLRGSHFVILLAATVFALLGVAMAPAQASSSAADAARRAAPQQRVSPLSFDVQFPAAALGKPYMQSMRPSGGVGGYTFAEGGTPPPGMQWVPAGEGLLLRGTPTQAGDYPLRIVVNDAMGQQLTKDVTFHVTPNDTAATVPVTLIETITTTDTEAIASANPLAISPATIPSGQAGSTYAGATFTATGGLGTPTVTSSGNIPTGMTFTQGSAKLVLAGSPNFGGTYPLTITATDSAGNAVSKNYNLVIAAAPPIVISPTTIPGAQLYVPYTGAMITATGGVSPITVSSSSTLPTGLSFIQNSGSSVVISGTPQQTGTYPVTVLAIDSAGNQATNTYSLAIGPAPALSVYPATITSSIAVGNVYPNVTFQGAGGSGSSTVALTGGSVPPGMTFSNIGQNSAAVLFGTPTKTGSYSFTVTATDTNTHATASQTYTINVTMPQYTLSPSSFPVATSGQSYSVAFTIVGGPAGYTLTMTNAVGLPAGLSYNASGETVVVAGVPASVSAVTTYGPFSFNLTDQYGNVQTLGPVLLFVEPAPVATIAVTTTPVSPLYTDQVTLNFAATGNYPSVPTGNIIATVDGTAATVLGTGSGRLIATLANGAASFNLGTLAPGTHTLIYTYSGDSVYPGTGAILPGQNPVTTATASFTVSYPPYYLTGTFAVVKGGLGYYDVVDASDNVIIADTNNNVIRKYDTSGNLSVMPSTGLNQPRGMALDGGGNLYIADSQNNQIVVLSPTGTQSVLPLGNITLNDPSALGFDASYQNLWIVDQNNGRVLNYNMANQSVTSGNTATGFGNGPISVAVAQDGTVYVGSQRGSSCGGLYKFTPGNGTASELTTPLCSARSLIFDRFGNLTILDSANDELYRMDASGTFTLLANQTGVNNAARDSQGNFWLIGPDLKEFVPGPAGYAGVAAASEGSYYPFSGTFTAYFHSPTGTTLTALASPSTSPYQPSYGFTASDSVAYANLGRGPAYPGINQGSVTATFSDGYTLTVPLYGKAYNTMLGISPGIVSQTATNTINATTSFGGVTTDANRNVYFSDTVANQVYSTTGGTINSVGFNNLNAPTQLAVDGSGAVYVLDSGTGRIVKHAAGGLETVVFDKSEEVGNPNPLASLTAFAMDGAGDLYVAGAGSSGQGLIHKLTALGNDSAFSTVLAAVPTSLAVDSNSTLYSGDATGALLQYSRSGVTTPLASGLGSITSLAIEPSGTVYATTSGSATLSVVSPQGAVSSYNIASVSNAVAVTEDGAGTLTVADATTGQLFSDVRDPNLLPNNGPHTVDVGFDFPNTVVGSSSPMQSYTLTNIGTTEDFNGNSGLTLTNVPGPQNFPEAHPTTTCVNGLNLTAGGSCALAFTFSPMGNAGSDNTSDNISWSTPHYNSGYSEISPTFTGTAISQNAVISFSASSLNFGNVVVGQSATQTLTVSNTGGGTMHFVLIQMLHDSHYTYSTNCGATLAAFASCTVNVTFVPGATGSDNTAIEFEDDGDGTGNNPSAQQMVTLNGTGLAGTAPYVFVANGGGSVSSLFSNGVVQSSAVAGGGIGAAVDRNGLVFSITADGTGVSTFNDNGTLANTTTGVLTGASALAIDGGDQLWIASPGSVSVGQILGSGQASIADPTLQKPSGIAIDLSGNVWISDSQSNTVHEIVGGGLPTQPIASAVTNKTPGTEPQ